MNIVELVMKRPFLFYVVDFEAYVGRYPENVMMLVLVKNVKSADAIVRVDEPLLQF